VGGSLKLGIPSGGCPAGMAQRSIPCGSDMMTPVQIDLWACTKTDTTESRGEKS
jgi:hypothetical protein